MSMIVTKAKTKTASIHAKVIKADGSTKDLGLISFYHKNFIINFVVNTFIKFKELFRK